MSKLPEGWTSIALSEACAKITDGTHHSPPNGPRGDFKYVTAKNIRRGSVDLSDMTYVNAATHREIYARCPVEKGDVLYIKDGATTGRAAINPLDEQFSMLSSVALLKPRLGLLDAGYLCHWLNSPPTLDAMLGQMTGSAIRRLTLAKIGAQDLLLPPLAEQRRIVAKLDTLTARTARACADLDRVPALADRFRTAVLSAWFGDKSERPDWDAAAAGQLFTWASGKFLPTKSQVPGPYPVYGGNGVNGRHNTALVADPTIVVGRVGAQCGNVYLTVGPSWVTDNAIYAATMSDRIDPKFALHRFRHAELNTLAGGSGQPYVNQGILNAVEFKFPGREEQLRVVASIETAFAEIDRLVAEAAAARRLLHRLDQAVLAKAFRGELVPQDPADEPASVLLDRIRAERASAPAKARRGRPVAA